MIKSKTRAVILMIGFLLWQPAVREQARLHDGGYPEKQPSRRDERETSVRRQSCDVQSRLEGSLESPDGKTTEKTVRKNDRWVN